MENNEFPLGTLVKYVSHKNQIGIVLAKEKEKWCLYSVWFPALSKTFSCYLNMGSYFEVIFLPKKGTDFK